MTSPVVIVSRDTQDRTVVSWYEDILAWPSGDSFAEIVAGRTINADRRVDLAVANQIADTWILLLQVPDYDVSYLATHQFTDDGLLEPIPGRAA